MHVVVLYDDIAFLKSQRILIKVLHQSVSHLIRQSTLAEALPLDEDAIARSPGDLVVGDGDPHVPLGEDAGSAPAPGDPAAVKIIVGDGHILLVSRAEEQQSMITLIGSTCRDHATF